MSKLNQLLDRLVHHQVELILVGGYAAVVHGAPNITQDVDVCFNFTPENLNKLWEALKDLHPVHRMTPQQLPWEFCADNVKDWKNLYLLTDWGVIDCLGEVKGIGSYDAVHAHSQVILVDEYQWRVMDLPTLIQAKLAMGRPHDKITALQLQAILESQG